MFCKKCGSKIIDGAQFCGNCGEKVGVTNTISEENVSAPKKHILKIVLIGFLIIFGGFLYFAISGGKSDSKIKKSVVVGDVVKFGKYEQDGNEENGKEDIEWEVLDSQDGCIMLLSRYVLDRQPYETVMTPNWYTSSVHEWLNGYFMGTAFDDSERQMLSNEVALLSLDDIRRYMNPEVIDMSRNVLCAGKLACAPTEYAKQLGVESESLSKLTAGDSSYNSELFKNAANDVDDYCKDNIATGWVLKDTNAFERENMVYVVGYMVTMDTAYCADYAGIRPVIWVRVE